MDYLQFTAAMFGSLVSLGWPAALFGVVWLFQSEIAMLLPNLKLRHGDTEIAFEIAKAEAALASEMSDQPEETDFREAAPENGASTPMTEPADQAHQLDEDIRRFGTSTAIMRLWLPLNRLIDERARALEPKYPENAPLPVPTAIGILSKGGHLSDESSLAMTTMYDIVLRTSTTANSATPAEARRFAILAKHVRKALSHLP